MRIYAFNLSQAMEEISRRNPVRLSFHYFDEQTLRHLNALVRRMLASEDLLFIVDHVMTILRELISNAVKANAKRLYFTQRRLDINDSVQYAEGISAFRDDVISRFEEFHEPLQAHGMVVEVTLQRLPAGFDFQVRNSATVLGEELDRINARIDRAIQAGQLLESYDGFSDFTEGAGLGIMMIVFLLKNIGVHPPKFDVIADEHSTTARFQVNEKMQYTEITSSVKDQINRELLLLPTFPENLARLIDLCKDPAVSIAEIIDQVMQDASISADVMKFARSAFMFVRGNVENIRDAVFAMGIRNLESILIAAGARRILNQRYAKFESVWRHCRKVAVYTGTLAETLRRRAEMEKAYLAGLLHDIGKLVLLAVDQDLTERITEIVQGRQTVNLPQLEEITIGISHNEIGEIIARRWNFPGYLVETIRHHHVPLLAPAESRDLVGLVCLANWIAEMYADADEPSFVEAELLEQFDILDDDRLEEVVARCRAAEAE